MREASVSQDPNKSSTYKGPSNYQREDSFFKGSVIN